MQASTIPRRQPDNHAGDVGRAAGIGAFGSLGRDKDLAGISRNFIPIGISAGYATSGIHQDDFMRGPMAARQQRLGGTRLIQLVKRTSAKGDVRRATRSLECVCKRTGSVHHPDI
jgi:hypothetical protein